MSPKRPSEPSPKVALGVAAHPDDLEFYAAGTLCKWAEAGADIYFLILTNGGKGTQNRGLTPKQLAKLRHDEQKKSADILGVKQVLFCDHEDAGLHNTKEVRREITHAIRKIKPDVIITFDPTMAYSPTYTTKGGFINHPDHRAAGQAVLDAVYPLARDHLSFPELIEEGLEPHTVGTLLLINFDTCNCFINISTTIEKKMAALHVHKSQQPDTDELRELAQVMGARANMDYAEAFVRIDIP